MEFSINYYDVSILNITIYKKLHLKFQVHNITLLLPSEWCRRTEEKYN